MNPSPRRKTFLDVVLFSWANNVWFGISVLAAIFVYSSLGSAIPPLRQHHLFEMTEMEWFDWWPFDLMIVLVCINMIVVTLKRIPLRMMNAGVWCIHTGIIVLAIGSVYYFATKVEGDIPVFRRQVVVTVPGQAASHTLLVRPGNHISVKGKDGEYHFSIAQIFPQWQIASGADKGKTAYMTWVDVVTPQKRFTRQLLAGYPQYTEDILPDRTRAKKTLGHPLVDESLAVSLDYAPQTEFFVMNTAALFLRTPGDANWLERPIDKLPHYHERIGSADDAVLPRPDFPLRPIDLPIPSTDEADPLRGYDVRVTGFLRYAFMRPRWRDGGDKINPVADISLVADDGGRADYTLVAFDPSKRSAEDGMLVFRWVESVDEINRRLDAPNGKITFAIPASNVTFDAVIPAGFRSGTDSDPFLPIADTGYEYRISSLLRDLPVPNGKPAGSTMSIVAVDIKTPSGTFKRIIANQAHATRDIDPDGKPVLPNDAVQTTFVPPTAAIVTVVTGPPDVGTHALIRDHNGSLSVHPFSQTEPVTIRGGLMLVLRSLHTHAVRDDRPTIVPLQERQRNVREGFSMIRVAISQNDWSHEQWLEFNRYALPNEQYAIPGRTTYLPQRVTLPDGAVVEMLFSRKRHALPAPIALESFVLATNSGGFSGAITSVRDFISQLRFKTDGGWTPTVQMSSNRPATNGGYWYFQSEWDPPARGSAGMNYTGLGVGNRNGVHIQLAGTVIAVAGMIFAFYVKPIIRRRKAARIAQRAARTPNDVHGSDSQSAEPELVKT